MMACSSARPFRNTAQTPLAALFRDTPRRRYPRDNRNIKPDNVVFMPPRVKAYLETGSDVTHPLLGAGEPQPKKGSPGNKNPAVLRYDPTGLRSTMSATWAETDKSLELHRVSWCCAWGCEMHRISRG
eukprot:TRINITY_DN3508_c0_g1_i3.p2 TRINITY_DN3508_c0_g1~~TRINITY_DN3508_c0_g1_i3.p2  ORF type:complete len:128 (-),score=19.79 TRINITY_DN3508_c0_g1_i3:108-491(-)